MLYYTILRYVMLRYTMLSCIMIYHAILSHVIFVLYITLYYTHGHLVSLIFAMLYRFLILYCTILGSMVCNMKQRSKFLHFTFYHNNLCNIIICCIRCCFISYYVGPGDISLFVILSMQFLYILSRHYNCMICILFKHRYICHMYTYIYTLYIPAHIHTTYIIHAPNIHTHIILY